MNIDPSCIENVRKETTAELIRWKSACKPSSPHHIAANVELVRRDDQLKSRLWTVLTIVAVALIVAAVVWFDDKGLMSAAVIVELLNLPRR